jgi:hypothetical protein
MYLPYVPVLRFLSGVLLMRHVSVKVWVSITLQLLVLHHVAHELITKI